MSKHIGNSGPASSPSEASFLERAEEAAEYNVRKWIQKTLEETFRQAFQKRLITNSEDQTKDIGEIEVSAIDLEDCFEVVERLSHHWQNELCQNKHSQVAKWVDDAYLSGKADLWSSPAVAEEGDPKNAHSLRNNLPLHDAEEHTAPSNGLEIDNSEEQLKLPYCQLRKMGKRSRDATSIPNSKDAAFILKAMGKDGVSYWPMKNALVEEVVDGIPKRVRSEQSNRQVRFQVVPRTVWERKQASQQGLALPIDSHNEEESKVSALPSASNADSQQALAMMLQRRRQKTKSSRSRTTKEKVVLLSETPRKPSDISRSTFNVNEELTTSEKAQLDKLVEDEANLDGTSIPTLFGPLKDIGEIHTGIEEEKHRHQGAAEHLTDKQRRRKDRAYIKERLAPRVIEKNQDPQKYRSKVLRTTDRADKTKNFLDLDLGWCLLEHEKDGEKGLLAFSSVEVTLEED